MTKEVYCREWARGCCRDLPLKMVVMGDCLHPQYSAFVCRVPTHIQLVRWAAGERSRHGMSMYGCHGMTMSRTGCHTGTCPSLTVAIVAGGVAQPVLPLPTTRAVRPPRGTHIGGLGLPLGWACAQATVAVEPRIAPAAACRQQAAPHSVFKGVGRRARRLNNAAQTAALLYRTWPAGWHGADGVGLAPSPFWPRASPLLCHVAHMSNQEHPLSLFVTVYMGMWQVTPWSAQPALQRSQHTKLTGS